MNNNVFNDQNTPLFNKAINTYASPTVTGIQAENASQFGILYFLSTGPVSVVANGFLIVQLTNPAGSGKVANIARISGGATVNTRIDIIRNASFAAAGTSLIPRNTNFGFSDSSVITVKYISQSTDPTTGGQLLHSFIQPSAGGLEVIDYDGRIKMTPGTTFVVRLANLAGAANLMSNNVGFWETPI